MRKVCRRAVEVSQARRGHGDICFPWRKAILINQLNPDFMIIICSGVSTLKGIDFCYILFDTFFLHILHFSAV